MIIYTDTDNTIDSLLEKDKATKTKRELEEYFEIKVISEVNHMLNIRVEMVV